MEDLDTSTRQRLIRAAILLSAGQNSNTPSHARRLLHERFGIKIFNCEAEVETIQLAADALREMTTLVKE